VPPEVPFCWLANVDVVGEPGGVAAAVGLAPPPVSPYVTVSALPLSDSAVTLIVDPEMLSVPMLAVTNPTAEEFVLCGVVQPEGTAMVTSPLCNAPPAGGVYVNVNVVGVVTTTLAGATARVPDPSGASPTETCGDADSDVKVPPAVDASLAANDEISWDVGVDAARPPVVLP
jgi:hypothetical protein